MNCPSQASCRESYCRNRKSHAGTGSTSSTVSGPPSDEHIDSKPIHNLYFDSLATLPAPHSCDARRALDRDVREQLAPHVDPAPPNPSGLECVTHRFDEFVGPFFIRPRREPDEGDARRKSEEGRCGGERSVEHGDSERRQGGERGGEDRTLGFGKDAEVESAEVGQVGQAVEKDGRLDVAEVANREVGKRRRARE